MTAAVNLANVATGPAFSAYLNTTQSVANTVFTKLQAGVEEFDTNSNYDNVTNYRFTPTVPGYYQINGQIYFGTSSSITVALITIYKNGSRFKDGNYMQAPGPNMFATVNALIYLNGTTDYLELYGLPTGTGSLTYSNNAPTLSYFQGYLARAA
jgi:hypothetical protein